MPRRHSWHSSPPLLNPPLLIILFPIVILTLLFLAVRPLLSAATRHLRPASSYVKTSWDSLNILLVVFAILCGVFARRNNDGEQTPNNHVHQHDDDAVSDRNTAFRRVQSEGQSQWFGFAEERKVYGNDTPLNQLQSPGTGGNRLRMRRNSSSYPDLRQWETGDDRYKFRFYDDFEIDKPFRSPAREYFPAVEHRKRWPESPPSPQPQQHQHQYQQQEEPQEDQVKEIPVDTFEIRPSPPSVKSTSPTPPPPPPPPPPESARRNTRRTHRKVERERESEITVELDDHEFTTIRSPPPAPPTPPHPPSVKIRSVRKSDRKNSTVKREMAMIWASVLSNQRKKKKKQKTKNNENHDQHYNDNVDELTNNTTVPPPPPPPPPPPSVFHSLFRKGLGKSKKIHSVSAPPPPPPPPPSKRKSQIPPPPEPPRRRNSGRPPLHNRTTTFNDETLNAGNQSPLTPVPPPPPPPPFKMKAMKFVVRGDFVKIRSNQSSRCSSPEREDIINASESTINNDAVTDAVNDTVNDTLMDRNVFCPSPDVNVKAATFIARLRGEWRLEKLNSLKEKGNGSLPCSL